MFALIAAVISAIVSLAAKGLGIQREQEIEITEGYLDDREHEQNKTLAYYKILSDKKRAALIISGVLIVGVFIIGAIVLLRKRDT